MPTIADYLKYANLQMASEALYGFDANAPGVILIPGNRRSEVDLTSNQRGQSHLTF